jgi:hypothetical protein
MKIEQILGSSPLEMNGKTLTKTQFLSGGQVYFTFAKVKAGEDREEESRREFTKQDGTKEITIKFKSDGGSGGKFGKSDPNTMLIAYSKDIVVAFINAGKIKEEKEAATQITNFTTLFKGLYDKLSKGENPIKTPENPPQSQTTVSARDDEPPMPSDEEIDVDSLPF